MCEQNSLQFTPGASPAYEATHGDKNPKGRPLKRQSITFGSQPQSIVSQLIQKMISQNNIILPIKSDPDENSHYNSGPVDVFDPIQSCLSPKPKKKGPKSHTCEFLNCGYTTKLSSNLQKHIRRHTGEKPYLCDRCSFRTNFSNSLKVHKRLHTTERPYQCTNCDYKCNSVSNLKKHSSTKHKISVLIESTVNAGLAPT